MKISISLPNYQCNKDLSSVSRLCHSGMNIYTCLIILFVFQAGLDQRYRSTCNPGPQKKENENFVKMKTKTKRNNEIFIKIYFNNILRSNHETETTASYIGHVCHVSNFRYRYLGYKVCTLYRLDQPSYYLGGHGLCPALITPATFSGDIKCKVDNDICPNLSMVTWSSGLYLGEDDIPHSRHTRGYSGELRLRLRPNLNYFGWLYDLGLTTILPGLISWMRTRTKRTANAIITMLARIASVTPVSMLSEEDPSILKTTRELKCDHESYDTETNYVIISVYFMSVIYFMIFIPLCNPIITPDITMQLLSLPDETPELFSFLFISNMSLSDCIFTQRGKLLKKTFKRLSISPYPR